MIQFKNVSKIYNKGKNEVKALDGVDLTFDDTGMVIILGKSGSGKSTLLNLLGGLDSVTSGEIIVDGQSIQSMKAEKMNDYRNSYVGFVFQNFHLIDTKTVYENIEISLMLQNNKADLFIIDDILSQIGLAGLGYRKPNELSGGQRQRVAIARAIVKKPNLIIADEPSGSLDTKTGDDLFITLKKFSKERLIIVVTHNTETAYRYGDRIIEIRDGKIVADKKRKDTGITEEIKMVKDNILFVKAGHKLSSQELGTLVKKDSDNFITIKEQKEQVILAYPETLDELDDNYKKSDFDENNTKKVNKTENTLRLSKAKPRLLENAKLALTNIKKRKKRIIMIVIASIVAMVMFNIILSSATISVSKVTAAAIKKHGVDFAKLERVIATNPDTEMESSADFLNKVTQLTDGKIGKSYAYKLTFLSANDCKNPINNGDAYLNKENLPTFTSTDELSTFNSIVEVKNFQDYGLTLVDGAYPQAYGEILISDYMYDVMSSIGFIKCNTDSSFEITYPQSYADVVGTKIYGNELNMLITGIYKTNNQKIKKMTEKTFADKSYYNATITSNYRNIFVADGFLNEHLNVSSPGTVTSKDFIVSFTSKSTSGTSVVFSRSRPHNIHTYQNENMTLLAGNLPSTLDNSGIVLSKVYATYIMDSLVRANKIPASSRTNYELLINNYNFTIHEKISSTGLTLVHSMPFAKIVAVVDIPKHATAEIFVSKDNLNSILMNSLKNTVAIVPVMSMSKSQISKLTKLMNSNGIEVNCTIVQSAYSMYENTFSSISSGLGVVLLVLIIFISLILINYVTVTVKERQKEMGIIRALGGGQLHTLIVFLFELLYISIFVCITTLIVSPIIIAGLNSSAMPAGTTLSILGFNFVNVLCTLFGYSLFICIIAFPSLWKILHIEPIKVINGL